MNLANQVFPEDYSCIVEPINDKGGLYIGNLEAAQNLNTLRRTYTSIKVWR